jgi:hypothetical protein
MASSISTEPPIEPRAVVLATIAEQAAAIDDLIPMARRHIRVFDQDLSQCGWNSALRAERLGLLLRVRGRRFISSLRHVRKGVHA